MWCKLKFSKAKRAKPSQASHAGNFGTDRLVNVQIGSVIANKSFELKCNEFVCLDYK